MRHFSGEFHAIRLLMEDELDLIAGGDGEDADEIPVVTVVGHADHTQSYYIPNLFMWGVGPVTAGAGDPEPTDASSIHIDVKITRPLSAAETKAVNDLAISIQNITSALSLMPDNEHVTLSNGMSVTGAELKDLWSRTDFTINEIKFPYANESGRGEADYNNGNPAIALNIDTLVGYDGLAGGMNYLPLHELGHMTAAGQAENIAYGANTASYDQNERLANDIAFAISSYMNTPILLSPGSGYSQIHPVLTP